MRIARDILDFDPTPAGARLLPLYAGLFKRRRFLHWDSVGVVQILSLRSSTVNAASSCMRGASTTFPYLPISNRIQATVNSNFKIEMPGKLEHRFTAGLEWIPKRISGKGTDRRRSTRNDPEGNAASITIAPTSDQSYCSSCLLICRM